MCNMMSVMNDFCTPPESDVYEDPRVLYELIRQDEEPVTLENYLVSLISTQNASVTPFLV